MLDILCRAGGNGTAGTAMAVPVFEGEKWRRLDSNLTCVIECPLRVLRRSLGRLRSLSLQAFKVATRELRLLNFLWRQLEHETSAQIGEGLNVRRVAVISGS